MICGDCLSDALLIVQRIEHAALSGFLSFGPYRVRFASGLVTEANADPTQIVKELIAGNNIPWQWLRTEDTSVGRFYLLILGILSSASVDRPQNPSPAFPSDRSDRPDGKDRTVRYFPPPAARIRVLPARSRPMRSSEFAQPSRRMFFRGRNPLGPLFPSESVARKRFRIRLVLFQALYTIIPCPLQKTRTNTIFTIGKKCPCPGQKNRVLLRYRDADRRRGRAEKFSCRFGSVKLV